MGKTDFIWMTGHPYEANLRRQREDTCDQHKVIQRHQRKYGRSKCVAAILTFFETKPSPATANSVSGAVLSGYCSRKTHIWASKTLVLILPKKKHQTCIAQMCRTDTSYVQVCVLQISYQTIKNRDFYERKDLSQNSPVLLTEAAPRCLAPICKVFPGSSEFPCLYFRKMGL